MRQPHSLQLPTGHRLILPLESGFASEAFICNGDVDWGSEKLLYQLLDNEGCFIDVGAHLGYYTLYMLPKVTAAYCFEPNPIIREHLIQNTRSHPNVTVLNQAMSDQVGNVNFCMDIDAATSHITTSAGIATNIIQVQATTIDTFVQQYGLQVSAIKVDAEGFDLTILKGAQRTLLEQSPVILTEAEANQELFDFAKQMHLQVFAFVKELHSRKTQFQQLNQPLDSTYCTKMLFLCKSERMITYTN